MKHRPCYRRPQPSYRPVNELTCPHGRYVLSCPRCELQRETGERTVGIRGDSRQRLDAKTPQRQPHEI